MTLTQSQLVQLPSSCICLYTSSSPAASAAASVSTLSAEERKKSLEPLLGEKRWTLAKDRNELDRLDNPNFFLKPVSNSNFTFSHIQI
jgi:hypothetical protein